MVAHYCKCLVACVTSLAIYLHKILFIVILLRNNMNKKKKIKKDCQQLKNIYDNIIKITFKYKFLNEYEKQKYLKFNIKFVYDQMIK